MKKIIFLLLFFLYFLLLSFKVNLTGGYIYAENTTGTNEGYIKNIILPQYLSTENLIELPKNGLASEKNKKNDVFMNAFLFVLFSVVFIMVFHFAINVSGFNFFLTLVYFVIGGVIGLWFNSWLIGLTVSIVLSLLFV